MKHACAEGRLFIALFTFRTIGNILFEILQLSDSVLNTVL